MPDDSVVPGRVCKRQLDRLIRRLTPRYVYRALNKSAGPHDQPGIDLTIPGEPSTTGGARSEDTPAFEDNQAASVEGGAGNDRRELEQGGGDRASIKENCQEPPEAPRRNQLRSRGRDGDVFVLING